MNFDNDIWPRVQQHAWKYRPRTAAQAPRLIELHCTRSGIAGRTPAQEYEATINWSLSPDNKNVRFGDDWASMESFIVGGGKVCRVLADDVWPHYSLGHADPVAYSIEIGQNLATTAFDPLDLANAARICAELSQRHNIPVRVLPWLSADNHEGGGYVRHDRSANGSYYGKSDPGPLFNDAAFEALVRGFMGQPSELEDDMATADELRAEFTRLSDETRSWFAMVCAGLGKDVRDLKAATEFLSNIAVNHEARLRAVAGEAATPGVLSRTVTAAIEEIRARMTAIEQRLQAAAEELGAEGP